jgi:hypothetical protein
METSHNRWRSAVAAAGGIGLIAWGAFHAYGCIAMRTEIASWDAYSATVVRPGRAFLVPGGRVFLSLLLFASLVTIAGGIAHLTKRRWALASSIAGVALLWGAPALFAFDRFGWSSIVALHHAQKLALSVAIVALPMVDRVRSRRA